MAVCEIWDVKGRLDHPIDYAKNPEKTVNPKYTEADLQALGDVMKYATNGEKTEKQFFVTGVNCDPATATITFLQLFPTTLNSSERKARNFWTI